MTELHDGELATLNSEIVLLYSIVIKCDQWMRW